MIILVLSLVGCKTVNDSNPNISRSQSDYYIKFWCDEETGVQYVIYNRGGGGGGITPRLNADGTLYCSPEIVE